MQVYWKHAAANIESCVFHHDAELHHTYEYDESSGPSGCVFQVRSLDLLVAPIHPLSPKNFATSPKSRSQRLCL